MRPYPDIRLRKGKPYYKYSWFELTEDCYISSELGEIVIPQGYHTDFATIPRMLWPLMPPHGRMSNPAIVHDFTYDNKIGEAQFGEKEARSIADQEFLIRCLDAKVPVWQAALAYIFVRLFGHKWWRK